jgi:hypothetical protein
MEDDANTSGDPQGKGFWVRGMYFGPFVRSHTYEMGLLKLMVEYLNWWQLWNRS